MPKKETIARRPARAEDRFGDPTGPVPAWIDISGATVVPRSSQEYEQRGSIIISGFMIVLPSSATVLATDEFRVRGETYQVDGAIGDYGRKKIFYVKRPN